MRRAIVIAMGFALAACGGDQHQDLKEELRTLTKDMRGRVDPLPVVKPYEPVPYQAGELQDPFGPAKIELVTKTTGGPGRGLSPDLNRPKEPLEAYPLESLKMVGVLQRSKQTFALVRADVNLYRVRAGNYMGQNFGLITGITENQIQLRELIQDPGGDWTERASTMQLQETEAGK
ncbi:MAG: pilus assembly protein PilP [Betaproteobacteria bacterium]|nr:pilus assembly protein PilP [Betaproteobacteria bacterium]